MTMCKKRSSVTRKLRGKPVRLDSCIADRIVSLNRTLVTVASCCGHGVYPETILCRSAFHRIYVLGSGPRNFTVIPRTRRFYRMDKDGFYFIPELQAAPATADKEGQR